MVSMRGLSRYVGATLRVHVRGGETLEGCLRRARRGHVELTEAAVLTLNQETGEPQRQELDGRLVLTVPTGSLVQVLAQ
jgi:hypothetical protein